MTRVTGNNAQTEGHDDVVLGFRLVCAQDNLYGSVTRDRQGSNVFGSGGPR
jgi:hypothetical protein